MTAVAPNYRLFELPWTPNDAEETRFKRLMAVGLSLWLVVVVGTRLLPTPDRPMAQPLPDEVVKLVLQPPPLPPKPPAPAAVASVRAAPPPPPPSPQTPSSSRTECR
jgi:hypothetical protein